MRGWRMFKYNYKPSAKELQTSLKLRSREFFLENSLHGVRYIVDPQRPIWERLMWLILTLSSLGATIGIIVIILRKFQLEPTITGVATGTFQLKLRYPRVLLCYDWDQLNTTLLPESDRPAYKKMYNWSWETSTLEGLANYKHKDDFSKTFLSMAPKCDAVLQNCAFNGVGSCREMFEPVLIPLGICCMYENPKLITMADSPWEVNFEAQTYPIRILLLSSTQGNPTRIERPTLELLDRAVLMTFNMYLTFSVPAIGYLMRRQRKCHLPSEQKPFHECLAECAIRQLVDRCGCLPWFLEHGRHQECPVGKYPCVNEAYQIMKQCDCMLPCNGNSIAPYKVRIPANTSYSLSSIRMTTWPWATYKRETRFGYLDLLVSFGGIGGLFLGYSVLTSVEMGYYLTLRPYCGAVVDSSRKKHNIKTVHVVEAKRLPSPDVKPIYFQYVD